MDYESEPYVRLASLRQLHQVLADVHTSRSLADTLQTVADGLVQGLGYGLGTVHLVRPDGDLVVAAVAGDHSGDLPRAGLVVPRETWDGRLDAGESRGDLRFVTYDKGRLFTDEDLPQYGDAPLPPFPDSWHPGDRLFAPMYTPNAQNGWGGDLVGILSADRPLNGRRPGSWGDEALQMLAFQAAIAISNTRLRANMQRAQVRLEQEQQALRASEESFRQAYEYAPSGMAIAELGGDQHGRFLRANDALCRMLGRPLTVMRRSSFTDLVHPEDMGTLLRTSAEGGHTEVRLSRHDGTYVWVSLRHSVVADTVDGPRFLLTHVEDIEERRHRELQLTHRASHDPLTGLPNLAELRTRLRARLCGGTPTEGGHPHVLAPEDGEDDGHQGLAVLFCDLDGMEEVNERFGHDTGDAVLVEVARRLAHALRESDTVARYGGDEFVVLAGGLNPAQCRALTESLRSAVTAPMWVDERIVRVGASFGTAWAACGMSVEEILRAADLRMYEDKRSRSPGERRLDVREIVPVRRTVLALPDHPVDAWVPQRPAAQPHIVRSWPTRGTETTGPAKDIEVHSGDELAALAGTAHVHRLVCRGDIADLDFLRHLPALRSLVIADNTAMSVLDQLHGCEKLRFLTVTGCTSLTDWTAVAATGVMFVEVGPGHAMHPLRGLAQARRLRELTLRGTLDEDDPDLVRLRSSLPEVRVRVTA